ncbi:MAG: TRAP transporter small permease [Thermodesulfobacteriota bacterium]
MEKDERKNSFVRIKTIFENCCGYLLLIAVFISLAEIVARLLFNTSFDLFFSFTVWISVWSILLITGLLLPEGGHLSVDFIRQQLGGRPRWLLEVCIALITLGYGVFISWGSILFINQLYQRKSVFPTYIAIPKWMVELCVPIGMFIFSVFALVGLIRAIQKKW